MNFSDKNFFLFPLCKINHVRFTIRLGEKSVQSYGYAITSSNRSIDLYDEYLGREYYIDPVTKESQWEHPNSTAGKSSSGRKPAGGDQVQVLHILAKHTGSRNPKNYKGETITRSKDDARKKIDG